MPNSTALTKTVAITQSNYLPWRGYFDLIRSVDEFILLDCVQYTRRDWRNRNKIRLLVNEKQANSFLNYSDDNAGDNPTSLHYKFVTAHRAVLNAKASPQLSPIANKQVEELNWKASVFLERLTTEFLQRATQLQLLEVPTGPGAAEQAAPADAPKATRR